VTRRSRRASSAPQRVGSDEGLTSSCPTPDAPESAPESASASESATEGSGPDASSSHAGVDDPGHADVAGKPGTKVGGRHTRRRAEQTKDDTDEGWGEPGDDDASARWLRENRPPHWS